MNNPFASFNLDLFLKLYSPSFFSLIYMQDAARFAKQIERALADIKNLHEEFRCLKKLVLVQNGSAK